MFKIYNKKEPTKLKNIVKFFFIYGIVISQNLYASGDALEIRNDDLVANYYPVQDASSHHAVLVLGGSEGGIPDKLAAPIVQAGYPVLALAYFGEKNLPEELENIPLEYFDTAIDWLLQQESINKNQLIVTGWSKGAELALLLASRDERISQVVAIAPSSVVWAGILKDWTKTPGSSWTENGKALTHIPFRPSGKVNGLLDLYSQSLENRNDNAKANIAVEQIKGTAVLMTGSKDEIWPSEKMAKVVCQRMNDNIEKSCTHINYKDLDHLLNYKFLDSSESMYVDFIELFKIHRKNKSPVNTSSE